MTADRQRAERCFSLARSTTFEGERDNAIRRGLAICEKAGLNPDTFDIPGRTKAKPAASSPPPREDPLYQSSGPGYWAGPDDMFGYGKAPPFYTAETSEGVWRKFQEQMRRQAETNAKSQAAAEAVQRAIAEKMRRQEQARRDAAKREDDIRSAAMSIMGAGAFLKADTTGSVAHVAGRRRTWSMWAEGMPLTTLTDDELLDAARSMRAGGR
jgi:hypothetical protein